MTSRARSGWVFVALALAGASCSRDPEDFCTSWVEETCEAFADCCRGGREFDPVACRMSFSDYCLRTTQAELVHAGAAFFDSGAARECLGTVNSCADQPLLTPTPATFEHERACANTVTGYLPPGAACNSTRECEHAGEYSTCYFGDTGGVPGLCAKVVRDDERCGFFFEDNVLRVCPDDHFCDLADAEPLDSRSPLTQMLVFSAPCRPRIAAGKSCIDTRNDTDLLPCQDGLYCEVTGADEGTCQKRKSAGSTCQYGPAFEECAEGLHCEPNESSAGGTCQKPDTGVSFFCVAPCGDGICSEGETAVSCPEDCAGASGCFACACGTLFSEGGCLDICDMSFNGTTNPNFCNGVLPLSQCAACIFANCGTDPANCTQ